jgi:hypothetical protein
LDEVVPEETKPETEDDVDTSNWFITRRQDEMDNE